jgi:hypothetical protein
MDVVNGSADVTTYFVLRDSTNHVPKTDVTITDIDLYYLEQGAAMAAKVDATALDAADSAHADNKAYHCGQGLYRIDWPDEAFNGGVGKKVELIVVCTGVDTTFLEVELKDPWQTGDSYAIVSHADYGNAKLARTGADSDTLETLSDQLDDIPTATENADALLKRDWTEITGEAARSVLNALRLLRNKWGVSGTILTVTKENDSTSAWTATVTTSESADTITGSDPD